MFSKGVRLLDTTNIMVEAKTIREGLTYCRDNNINNIIVESESLALV